MPYNSATVQSDGNLSGGLFQPWVVRYGQWLIAGNPTANASTVQLPAGSGLAIDLVSSNTYSMGAVVPVPPMVRGRKPKPPAPASRKCSI